MWAKGRRSSDPILPLGFTAHVEDMAIKRKITGKGKEG